jgi:hypothetical protein
MLVDDPAVTTYRPAVIICSDPDADQAALDAAGPLVDVGAGGIIGQGGQNAVPREFPFPFLEAEQPRESGKGLPGNASSDSGRNPLAPSPGHATRVTK